MGIDFNHIFFFLQDNTIFTALLRLKLKTQIIKEAWLDHPRTKYYN